MILKGFSEIILKYLPKFIAVSSPHKIINQLYLKCFKGQDIYKEQFENSSFLMKLQI